MKFISNQLAKLAGITRVNLRQQMNLGFYGPSIRKGTGKGSSKNIFSLADVYKIRIINDLIAAGWARTKAADFIKAIDYTELTRVLAVGFYLRDRINLNASLINDFPIEKFIEITGGDQKKAEKLRAYLIDKMMQMGADVSIWLVFARFGEKIACRPAIEDDPRSEKAGAVLSQVSGYSAVLAELKAADEIYVYRLTRAMDAVDRNLMTWFPEKVAEFNATYLEKIRSSFKGSNTKIKTADFIENISSIISGK